jgi:5'-AMP-activated protein kinase catalytic alpha subunit
MKVYHPNIVQLYEVIENQDQVFLVMEYVSNGDLQKLIEKIGLIPEKQACLYFKQLLSGIEYIHNIGCAHRDLKPENLLISEDNTIKISDFGLSNTYIFGEQLHTPCGSPCFAAPEMITGQKYDPRAVDIWSCGITLYLMLTGSYPF